MEDDVQADSSSQADKDVSLDAGSQQEPEPST
jgi:hypothetical protein